MLTSSSSSSSSSAVDVLSAIPNLQYDDKNGTYCYPLPHQKRKRYDSDSDSDSSDPIPPFLHPAIVQSYALLPSPLSLSSWPNNPTALLAAAASRRGEDEEDSYGMYVRCYEAAEKVLENPPECEFAGEEATMRERKRGAKGVVHTAPSMRLLAEKA